MYSKPGAAFLQTPAAEGADRIVWYSMLVSDPMKMQRPYFGFGNAARPYNAIESFDPARVYNGRFGGADDPC